MNQKKNIGSRLLEVFGYNKRKKLKLFKKELLAYLTSVWQFNHDPSLKEVVCEFNVLDNESKKILIKLLRHLRVRKIVDGYYDQSGIYRICNFKQNIIK